MNAATTTTTWTLVHAERRALAADLAGLTDEQWRSRSLCTEFSVREVVAHLTAGATLSFPRWFAGVLRQRFDFDAQVLMRLREQLGESRSTHSPGSARRLTAPPHRWGDVAARSGHSPKPSPMQKTSADRWASAVPILPTC
ncbi:hypothetical protein GCM10009789_35180 [Kribbella sancticallisti]|uniref:Mycothiol-dependent maleylpyruvate isomerase metal-binding domain-containing protein n=1 Tax=Kribbella sancticallisti TaxID=460087 RepID=A0ABN2DLU0_9ACTN